MLAKKGRCQTKLTVWTSDVVKLIPDTIKANREWLCPVSSIQFACHMKTDKLYWVLEGNIQRTWEMSSRTYITGGDERRKNEVHVHITKAYRLTAYRTSESSYFLEIGSFSAKKKFLSPPKLLVDFTWTKARRVPKVSKGKIEERLLLFQAQNLYQFCVHQNGENCAQEKVSFSHLEFKTGLILANSFFPLIHLCISPVTCHLKKSCV